VEREPLKGGGKYVTSVLAISIVLSLAATAAPRDVGGYRSPYDPRDIETVCGTVKRIETLPRAGGGRDVTLVLRTDIGDEVPVAVAPRWVLAAFGLRLHEGDAVQVIGWRIVTGKPALLAAEIGKGTQLFVFRDRHGVTVWGRRRRLKPPPTHRVGQPD
jgi:hypothetical protein